MFTGSKVGAGREACRNMRKLFEMGVASISRYVLGHKLRVASVWFVLFVVGVVLLPWATGNLSESFSMPGTESSNANDAIIARYGSGGFALPIVPVVTLPEGTTVDSPGVRDQLLAVDAKAHAARPEARIASWASTGDDSFVSADRRTTFSLIYLLDPGTGSVGTEDIQLALAGTTIAGAPLHLTGYDLLDMSHDSGSSGGPSVLVETLIGGIGALLVLIYIFGSFLAFLPILIAAIAIVTSFLLIGFVGWGMDVNSVVQYLVALIGLGVAIDYSLLVVNRWRQERRSGLPNEVAVQRAMETAGHAVVFSGTTVGIGLLALVLLPVPMFRGIGIGGMIIPLVSVLVTITLLPIILAKAGPRLDWPRSRARIDDHAGWARFAQTIIRHRWAAAITGLAILGTLTWVATTMEMGSPRPDSLNGVGDPQIGLKALEAAGFPGAVLAPFEVITNGDSAALATQLQAVDGVFAVIAPETWQSAGTAVMSVIVDGNGGGNNLRSMTGDIRAVTHASSGNVLVGGAAAYDADFTSKIYDGFPLMVIVVAVITCLLLMRAFRSIILPLKALALNVLSIGASFGILVLIWQYGWGSELMWGIPATGAITSWVPIMAFAFLFGLSMDYEVFILHRMREEYDRTGDTDTAVVNGLAHTGKLVTCAALILVLAFVSMASGPETNVKIIATVLAAGILIDATVVRVLLVPALISLMGPANWWMPRRLSRFGAKDQHLDLGSTHSSPAD